MRIVELDTLAQVRDLGDLLREYLVFVTDALRAWAGITFDVDVLVANSEKSLPKVIPPFGRTFAAEDDEGRRFGMVFLRPSSPDAMEIKRLYVRPEGRGTGAGRALVEHAVAAARAAGARALRLDTSGNLTDAIRLYERMGFVRRGPYEESDHFGDEAMLPYLVFMEKPLD